jgi:hypothetical protein
MGKAITIDGWTTHQHVKRRMFEAWWSGTIVGNIDNGAIHRHHPGYK